jgi:hypothetical protein
VLWPTYDTTDVRGKLVFEKTNNPNWTHTFFTARSTPGSATISGSAPGQEAVPTSVTTVSRGGAPTALRILALATRVPALAVRNYAPIAQPDDAIGLPTVTLGLSGATDAATLTASAPDLAPSSATLTVVP